MNRFCYPLFVSHQSHVSGVLCVARRFGAPQPDGHLNVHKTYHKKWNEVLVQEHKKTHFNCIACLFKINRNNIEYLYQHQIIPVVLHLLSTQVDYVAKWLCICQNAVVNCTEKSKIHLILQPPWRCTYSNASLRLGRRARQLLWERQ